MVKSVVLCICTKPNLHLIWLQHRKNYILASGACPTCVSFFWWSAQSRQDRNLFLIVNFRFTLELEINLSMTIINWAVPMKNIHQIIALVLHRAFFARFWEAVQLNSNKIELKIDSFELMHLNVEIRLLLVFWISR